MSYNLTAFHVEAIQSFCRLYHVRELSVFGSALREGFREDSDIDLLVEFEPEAHIGLLTFARMQRELSDLLQRKVDLVPKSGLKSFIRKEILSSARVLYEA